MATTNAFPESAARARQHFTAAITALRAKNDNFQLPIDKPGSSNTKPTPSSIMLREKLLNDDYLDPSNNSIEKKKKWVLGIKK